MSQVEHKIQCAVFSWAELMEYHYPDLKWLRSSLAGVKISMPQQVKAKRAGFKAGYPDIMLDVPRGGYHGLRIELKKDKKSYMSKAQREWIQHLSDAGYYAYCCKGYDDTVECIERYMRMEAA